MERLICIAIGYVCGLFQTAYILGKVYHTDIRKQGSGNLGSTNDNAYPGKEGRGIEPSVRLPEVHHCDHGRENDLPGGLCGYSAPAQPVCGAGCILGHNFPFYLNFKG